MATNYGVAGFLSVQIQVRPFALLARQFLDALRFDNV